ncbi:MAG TPA: hypothetical protein PLB62_12105, partial [Candidatus Sumerlaeota bacterium]|nr:hypothetical protein [Candidatus Sumerlaeota bacterium]
MYSGKKVFVVLLSVMLMSSLALAATFSAGGGQGVSTVGTLGGEDYATLAAAATDFNTYAGGCTGDWTLQ